MARNRLHNYLLVILSLFLLGCESQDTENNSQATQQQTPPLVMAVLPYDVPTKIHRHFAPLLTYLSQSLKRPVKLYVATSYEDQILKLSSGQVDFGYLGPTSFVRAYDRFITADNKRIQPIATEIPYQAAIVVHKDSTIEEISDLKNHTFAFGAYHSFAGHFKIRDVLKKNDLSLSDLKLYSFLGRHERAVMSVVYKEFEVAAASTGVIDRIAKLNYPIKTIYTTEKLAPIAIVASPYLSKKIVDQLKNNLLKPNFEGQEAITLFAPSGAFFPFENSSYDSVRAILNEFEN